MHGAVNYAKADRVATLTMAGADGNNALSAALCDDIRDALAEAQADPGVRVVVLTSAGENFCVDAPTDPSDPHGDGHAAGELFGLLGIEVTDALLDFDKPVIASIGGAAAGRGCDLAVCCDIRIAAETASIGTTQICQGLVPGASVYFLPRIVRFGKASELMFTGEMLSARQAGDIGLFDYVVPAVDLALVTAEMASHVAAGPPIAMRLTKRAIYRGLTMYSDAAKEYTVLARSLGMHATNESREGFNSFNERRAPNF